MKLYSGFLSFILVFILLLSPVFAQDEDATGSGKVDVYAVFWPIVPGKTVGDPMFMFKQIKEGIGLMFSFGDIEKSKYQIGLSEKRLVEANKLFEDKDYANGLKSLELNKEHRDQALKLKKKAGEAKSDILELTNIMVKSLENQEKALVYLAIQVPDDQKSKLGEFIKELELQISEAK